MGKLKNKSHIAGFYFFHLKGRKENITDFDILQLKRYTKNWCITHFYSFQLKSQKRNGNIADLIFFYWTDRKHGKMDRKIRKQMKILQILMLCNWKWKSHGNIAHFYRFQLKNLKTKRINVDFDHF